MLLLDMRFTILEYLKLDGKSPYKKWFDSLPSQAAAKITIAKLRLERGNTSNVKWFLGIGEYKIDWGSGYRIYFAKESHSTLVLFGGGTKRSQQRDINTVLALYAEYKERKKLKR
jgi:putative addiction module killer protein